MLTLVLVLYLCGEGERFSDFLLLGDLLLPRLGEGERDRDVRLTLRITFCRSDIISSGDVLVGGGGSWELSI